MRSAAGSRYLAEVGIVSGIQGCRVSSRDIRLVANQEQGDLNSAFLEIAALPAFQAVLGIRKLNSATRACHDCRRPVRGWLEVGKG